VKVLVYPHLMEIGGSQLNAVETAAAVRDRGHDVSVISRPGPLVETVRRLGLSHIPLDPRSRRRPSPRAAAQLTQLVREHKFDVVHGYEWPPGVDAFTGPRLRLGTPVVCTVYSATVAPFLPRIIPLIVSTDDIRRRAAQAGHTSVTLLEPPVDVRANSPEHDPGSFRKDHGLDPAVPLVAAVSRLLPELKLEGLLAACDAVGELVSSGVQVQLAIVGGGLARPMVEEAAAAANARAGHQVVVLTGELQDPRPAYAAADMLLGMGSSALRAMAFGKPLVVQGERGFWELLTPESAPAFLRQGWYGIGSEADGRSAGAARLQKILRELLDDRADWARLGTYGRTLVVERCSLDRAAAVCEELYLSAIKTPTRTSAIQLTQETTRAAIGLLQYKVNRRWQRWRGTAAIEDFNAWHQGGAK
jgi:glycosyltransferase involved in cell wall biosynthesis